MTSPRDQQSEERRKRAGYLYSKPKVGAYYQAKVPRFNAYSTTKSSSVQPSNKALKTVSSQSDILEDTSLRIENWKGDRRSKEYRGKQELVRSIFLSSSMRWLSFKSYLYARNDIFSYEIGTVFINGSSE